ncbi:MAG: YaiI/YqxD family protein [Rubripirellula sp.]|nr:YaiI/YqxD family protein [Planctomycetaceae bacterium]MDF1843255.1 YaiI/YqxD family protein [Rubripirellula sp.]
MKIWIDADACPVAIREILFRTAERLRIETTLVANQSIAIAKSAFIRRVTVRDGADIADDRIVELMQRGDLVITSDIPLASRVVEKEGVAISPRGELFDDKSVHERLAARNLMEQFRSAGFETGGPKPLSQKDVQTFANQLDRSLTRLLQRNKADH